jgi:hypothetical protein
MAHFRSGLALLTLVESGPEDRMVQLSSVPRLGLLHRSGCATASLCAIQFPPFTRRKCYRLAKRLNVSFTINPRGGKLALGWVNVGAER